jgi:nitrogen-specific signal transduction histidine kinase
LRTLRKVLAINFESIILDNLREGIILLDKKLNFLFINQEAEGILGKSQNFLQKKDNINIIDKKVVKLIKEVKKNLETKFVSEIKITDSLGSNKLNSIYLRPIFNYKTKEPSLVYILVKITNLEGTSFLNKQTKFEDEEKLMSQLFYGLAHEIKNPLAGIKGAAQIVKKNKSSFETIKECSEIIEKEAVRLENLVNTFKYLQPHSEQSSTIVELSKVIDEVIKLCSQEHRNKKTKVFTNYENESAKVLCDESLIRIIFLNIIQNSYDSIKSSGEIKITIKRAKDFKLNKKNFVQVEIQDSGKGISKAGLVKIFQPFYTTKKDGQGIGLFLSQKIANKFGGFIEVRSILKSGTKFTIYLPGN